MELKIALEEQEDGGYTVQVPALPGCISEGDTLNEAIKTHNDGKLDPQFPLP